MTSRRSPKLDLVARRQTVKPNACPWAVSILLLLLGLLWVSASGAQESPDFDPSDLEEFNPEELQRARAGARSAPDDDLILPEEPISPREELFLAIELKDVEAARVALARGGDVEISNGEPSPLATAALHNDLRMVALLLEAGGDPGATTDSPLEEAIRNENIRMVEMLMRSGAQVPTGTPGNELFRLAQRGAAAAELSTTLLDLGADAGQCLIAATGHRRTDLMRLCLERGADAGAVPVGLNPLGVAIANEDAELIDMILVGESANRLLVTAFTDAVAAGRTDLVQRAFSAGAVPAFEQVEAAIENGQPELALLLLDQGSPDDASMLAGGDVEALVQRAEDLDYADVAAALRSKAGISAFPLEVWLPVALGALLVVILSLLLLSGLSRRRPRTVTASGGPTEPRRTRPRQVSSPEAEPRQAGSSRAVQQQARPGSPEAPPADLGPATAMPNSGGASAPASAPAAPAAAPGPAGDPAATLPIGAIPMMPSVAASPESPAAPVAKMPEPHVSPPTPPGALPAAAGHTPVAPAPAAPAAASPESAFQMVDDVSPAPATPQGDEPPPAASPAVAPPAVASPPADPSPTAAPVPFEAVASQVAQAPAAARPPAASLPTQAAGRAAESSVWHVAPEPVAEEALAAEESGRVAAAAEQPAVELRMPEVDLSRDAGSVFDAARKAGSGETVRPDAPDRRQVVLVTPARVTMLRSCPAPGSLKPEELAVAARLVGAQSARNIAAIAYTDLDAIGDRFNQAIPFFDLLRQLGYLGHTVWIFEGHVSAMAAGCRDADVLIVDDGMMPYLPGNWRSVASRVMRGSDIHVFERKTGSLRQLK